jgi:hypothetical protein
MKMFFVYNNIYLQHQDHKRQLSVGSLKYISPHYFLTISLDQPRERES